MMDWNVRPIADRICLPFNSLCCIRSSLSSISRAGMNALRYSRHPGPDSRLPSRHVACPTSLGYFRSVSRGSVVVGLSLTSISASGRRTARHGTVLSAWNKVKPVKTAVSRVDPAQCTVRRLERRLRTA